MVKDNAEDKAYVDTLVKNKSDGSQNTTCSLIKHTQEEIEMERHHDYEEVEVKKGTFEHSYKKDTLKRLKYIIFIMAGIMIVIVALVFAFALIFYRHKPPGVMSAFSVNTPYSYNDFNGTSRLIFANSIYQYGQDFSLSTGVFTCSIPGIYHFSVTMVRKGHMESNSTIHCKIHRRNNKDEDISVIRIADIGCRSVSQTFVIDLDIGDTMYLGTCHDEDTYIHLEWWSSFTGFLLHPYKN